MVFARANLCLQWERSSYWDQLSESGLVGSGLVAVVAVGLSSVIDSEFVGRRSRSVVLVQLTFHC